MTPQEQALLAGLFDRLKQADGNPRESEAERYIADAVRQQPAAPYFMAQLLLVQDQALTAAQARIRQLEQDLEKARTQPPQPLAPTPPPGGSGRSFLGDAPPAPAGPWGSQRAAARSPGAVPPVASPAFAPGALQAQGGSGGFLRGALQTAAGVAGGALLFEGLSSLFHHGSPWGGGAFPGSGGPSVVEETIINEYGGGSGDRSVADAGPATDAPAADQAAADDPTSEDLASDDLPGDDGGWADGDDGDDFA